MDNDKKHILLIDDDSVVLQAGKMILSDSYQITTASSAENILELVKTNKPDLILLDIIMPNINGYEAIKILKEDPEIREIPVIFLSGKTEVNAKLEGYSLGAVDYITKPFDPDALLSRIKLGLM